VRRRVAARLALVVRDGDHVVAHDDDGAHGHLAPARGLFGRGERAAHEGRLALRRHDRGGGVLEEGGGGGHRDGLLYYHLGPPVPKPQIDLSFPRFVAARKGAADARAREGSAYAYGGDLKVRATLDRVRPVTLAVEATVRLWQTVERSRMLGTAVKVTPKQFPRVWKLV